MIAVKVNTQKLQDYFQALALRTEREMPVFVRGQAFSLVTKITREMKTAKKRQKSIRKMFKFYRLLKEGKSKKGVIVHERAQKMADERAPGGYANIRTRDTDEKLGRLRPGRRETAGQRSFPADSLRCATNLASEEKALEQRGRAGLKQSTRLTPIKEVQQ